VLLHRGHIAVRRPGEGARQFQDLSSTDRDPVGLVKDGAMPTLPSFLAVFCLLVCFSQGRANSPYISSHALHA
jgi:hypothetical protein